MKKTDNCTEYIEAIKKMVKIKGVQAANDANHKALETGMITLPMFQAAGRVLVKEYMKQH